MEYIDVLDQYSNKTGLTKLKSEVHKDGDWHRVVHIWIINQRNELLIQKRSPSKENYPNLLDVSVGGHISANEDSIAAVLREVKEELGLELNKKDIRYLSSVRELIISNSGTYIDNEVQDIFLVRSNSEISSIVLQKREIAEVKFIDFKKLKQMITENPKAFVPHFKEYKKLFEFLEENI